MSTVLVTQRVVVDPATGERRDALDQRWPAFLAACGLTPLLVPNHLATARRLLATAPLCGVLLTGGNDLARYGGDAPERDEVERELLRRAGASRLPVLGVCRGMQLVLDAYGAELEVVDGHVRESHTVLVEGVATEVNSYHRWGCRQAPPELEVWARAEDGVVEGVRLAEPRVVGVLWHPERHAPARPADLELFRATFRGGPPCAR